jgi:hypothetical protein
MQFIGATGLHGKSGGAEWRDLRFSGPLLEMFSCIAGKTFPRKSIHTEISPLRCAPVEMTKGRVVMVRNGT